MAAMRGTTQVRGSVVLVAVAVSGWLVALVLGASFFVSYDGRQDIDLAGYLQDPYLPGARLATDEVCDDEFPCVQALEAETATMARFDDQQEAAAWASTLGGDVRLAGWIVVRFEDGRLLEEQRSEFMAAFYCTHVGAGPC
jgi:hypothetical protein